MPVVEGETDYLLLEAIILELFPTARLLPIQPTEPGKGGWRDVQKWCQETWQRPGASLAQIISGQTGPKLDLLIIHVDADIARQSNSDLQKNVTSPITDVLQPCPPSVDTVNKLLRFASPWGKASGSALAKLCQFERATKRSRLSHSITG